MYIATYNCFDFKYSRIFEGIKEQIIMSNKTVCATVENVRKIRSYNFDKVIFCEIGMDGNTHILSHFRLGRIHIIHGVIVILVV